MSIDISRLARCMGRQLSLHETFGPRLAPGPLAQLLATYLEYES
jgi:hypothetical protein